MGKPLPGETGQSLQDQVESLRQQGIELRPPFSLKEHSRILTPEALLFVADLQRRFSGNIDTLLMMREGDQAKIDRGELPDFLLGTIERRQKDWEAEATIRGDINDRRNEITGPADVASMVINGMNSGAKVDMVDFEDALSPTGENIMRGQQNLFDLVRRTITYDNPEGKHYELNPTTATLMVRPRGWHLTEKHMLVDGNRVSAPLLDFGLHFFHNAQELIDRGSGPYFYLPKLQNHLEARLWNDVFAYAQEARGIPQGTIRATVLIEHILAAFQTHEILWELREHTAGENCGRWDYLFSIIKTFRNHPKFILPDRAQVNMDTDMMRAYAQLVIDTCHRRGVHAIGGMSAFIPSKNPEVNALAFAQVKADKEREVMLGHDGTWVAHPGLVGIAQTVFDEHMPQANQIDRPLTKTQITAEDLLRVPQGTVTEVGARTNIEVGLRYIAAWLGGKGAVVINDLMEDAATAEISRSQIWQWIHHKAVMNDGRVIDEALFKEIFQEEFDKVWREAKSEEQRFHIGQAGGLFLELALANECPEFFTTKAYELLS